MLVRWLIIRALRRESCRVKRSGSRPAPAQLNVTWLWRTSLRLVFPETLFLIPRDASDKLSLSERARVRETRPSRQMSTLRALLALERQALFQFFCLANPPVGETRNVSPLRRWRST